MSLPLTVLSRFPVVTVFVHRLSVSLDIVGHKHGMVEHWDMIWRCVIVFHMPNNSCFVVGQCEVGVTEVGVLV